MTQQRPLNVSLIPGPTDRDPRRHPRERVSCYLVWDHRRRENEEGEILDVSPTGLFISADWGVPDYLEIGDVIWGRFSLNGNQHIFSATVRWRGYSPVHGRQGIGLELNDTSSIPTAELEEFVKRHSLVPGPADAHGSRPPGPDLGSLPPRA